MRVKLALLAEQIVLGQLLNVIWSIPEKPIILFTLSYPDENGVFTVLWYRPEEQCLEKRYIHINWVKLL